LDRVNLRHPMAAPIASGVLALLLLYSIYVLGYSVEQSDFAQIAIHFGIAFLAYAGLYLLSKKRWIPLLLLFGGALRLLLVFGLPNLSDDIYRFVWDGRLLLQGLNPFDYKPIYYAEQGFQVPGLTPELFEKLNSPEYFTIYPPVAQLVFLIANWFFPSSIWGASLVMKCFLLTAESGVIFILVKLLQHFKLPIKLALLYALNPLLIIEIVGNLHFEGMMIFFLLLAYWFWINSSWWKGAFFMALAIASKLLPLLFLPFLIRRMGWIKSLKTFALIGGLLILFFLPLFSGVFLSNFSDSLDLYFRRFEFNGSIYYFFRWLGYQYVGHNLIARIGPILALCTFILINAMALLEREKDWKSWASRSLAAISVYLFFTTTVHPWYVSLPVVLCIFSSYRFPILWSALITLTYINYSYGKYAENLWIVLLEYTVLFFFIGWEFFFKKTSHPSNIL